MQSAAFYTNSTIRMVNTGRINYVLTIESMTIKHHGFICVIHSRKIFMKKAPTKLILGLLAGLFCLLPFSATAEDNPPPLSETWMVTPKAGHIGEFQAAFKEHGEFRQAHGEPWKWQVYTSIVGDDLNRYAIRFCCANWADLDAYEKWNEANPEVLGHWWENVAPHVEKMEHFYNEIDWNNSHWPADAGPFRYFAVTLWGLKGGHETDFAAARKVMSQVAINQGWATPDRNWIWSTTIGGKEKNALVIPHKNFASMAGGEETFYDFLAQHMGSAEAAGDLMKKFSSSTWGSEFTIWEHVPELSMSEED